MLEDGHEIAGHGWRWINYQFVDEETERAHIRLAVETITALTGSPPLGLVYRSGQSEYPPPGR